MKIYFVAKFISYHDRKNILRKIYHGKTDFFLMA